MIHKDSKSPWGKVQLAEYITPWLTRVHTAGHGGYKVDRSHNGVIPEYARRKGGWYEEDCEWSIVFSTLESLIKETCFDFSKENCERIFKENCHKETFKNWYPQEYEMFFNVKLKEGESYIKDSKDWEKRSQNKWHVVGAGMVDNEWCKLTLCFNGEREHIRTPLARELLVRKEEYKIGKLREKHGTALTEEQIRHYENIANTERNCITV